MMINVAIAFICEQFSNLTYSSSNIIYIPNGINQFPEVGESVLLQLQKIMFSEIFNEMGKFYDILLHEKARHKTVCTV